MRFHDDLGALCGGLTEVTQNKYLNRLSRYWTYLLKREVVEANPWAGLKVEVPSVPKSEQERAFTDAEVQRLLMGGAEDRVMDLMMIGALTGARLDAIVDLRVKDAADGIFTFKPQKKELEGRDVPIHPALREIVDRRIRARGRRTTSSPTGRRRAPARTASGPSRPRTRSPPTAAPWAST